VDPLREVLVSVLLHQPHREAVVLHLVHRPALDPVQRFHDGDDLRVLTDVLHPEQPVIDHAHVRFLRSTFDPTGTRRKQDSTADRSPRSCFTSAATLPFPTVMTS
jgi:hypothetical protein